MDLRGQEQAGIHAAFRVRRAPSHVVLKFKGHTAILRHQLVGVESMAIECRLWHLHNLHLQEAQEDSDLAARHTNSVEYLSIE